MMDLPPAFDLQGHRGCRGLFPENTLPAFEAALAMGVTTLEMDVVISADKKVVVSHDPWMAAELCKTPSGKDIEDGQQKQHLIYNMDYAEARQYDCGSKGHHDFPMQKKINACKPLLSEVIDFAEAFCRKIKRPLPFYNIETKCTPEGDDIYHPSPEIFCRLLSEVITKRNVVKRSMLQSFDVRTLQVFREMGYKNLSLLVENEKSPEATIASLGFVPAVYSPEHILVDDALMHYCKTMQMRVLPWTVNAPQEMQRLISLGVAGIITDYPNLLLVQN